MSVSKKNITWERKNFPAVDATLSCRQLAEIETERDLHKDVQQLICDVHEESLNPLPTQQPGESKEHYHASLTVLQLQRLVGAQKRMVSMMGRVALEHERSSNRLVVLTWVLVAMTAVLIWLTIVLVAGEKTHEPNQSTTAQRASRVADR